MVPREVAFGKVHGGVRLIIEAVVDLRGVAKVSAVLAVDHPIESPVVAPFKERAGNGRRGLVCETVRLCECEFIQRGRVYGLSLVFTLPLNGSEAEKFVLAERPADGTPELLARIVRVSGNRTVWVSWRWSGASGIFLVGVQIGVTEVPEDRTVVEVRARLGDHVDGRAFGAPVYCREALCADLEFLHRFQGKLQPCTERQISDAVQQDRVVRELMTLLR